MKILLIFLCILAINSSVTAKNKFCDIPCSKPYEWCFNNRTSECEIINIGCTDNGEFHERCINPKEIHLDRSLKQAFVDAHNERRNLIAGGGIPGYGPACRMASMRWDNDLAHLALLQVKRCDGEHDDCHNTEKFRVASQNIFGSVPLDIREHIKRFALELFSEIRNATPSDMDKLVYDSRVKYHFITMVTESNTHLGCGVATHDIYSRIYSTCNYARTYTPNEYVFEKCAKAAEKCKTGPNPKYPNLCSLKEKYDVNVYYGYKKTF